MLSRSLPSGQLADLDSNRSDTGLESGRAGRQAERVIDSYSASQGQWRDSSNVKSQRRPDVPGNGGFEPAARTPSAAMTMRSAGGIDRTGSAISSVASSTRLDARNSLSSNPSASSSTSSSNTIALPMSSGLSCDSSSAIPSSVASNPSLYTQASPSASHAYLPMPQAPPAHLDARHPFLRPAPQLLASSIGAAAHGNSHGDLLHPLRVSTRPSTKRASSFSPGLVVSPQGYGAYHTSPSSPLCSPVTGSDHRSGKLSVHQTAAQASSISLPTSGEEALQYKLEELVRNTHLAQQQQHHQQGKPQCSDTHPGIAGAAGVATSHVIAFPDRSRTSRLRDGYEAEREGDSEGATPDPSQPSSLTSHLGADLPTFHPKLEEFSPYRQLQQQSSAHIYSRQHDLLTHQQKHTSPHIAGVHSSVQGRSRETSGSSVDNPNVKDFALDDQTDLDPDTGTDLASDAGNTTWDVRETDKLRSAKDAYGRRMINQYARVAELGRGVHGKVWLCEDTETGEFYAIKSVNREDRRNKSLKRSQAEAQAKARVQELEDKAKVEEQRRLERERSPNASFDEHMQLSDPTPQPFEKELARKRSAIVRKTMMDEKVKQEIAIMKRIHHPNVVQLREVIDDIRSKKIFMVLEYMPGGQVEWSHNDEPLMTVDETRRVFRDVVLGLEYLHFNGIIHRDIKPANLLWTQDKRTAKISDFGVSHVSEALARSSAVNPVGGRVGLTDDRALRKTEGSPAFFAPELCSAFEITPVGTPINELGRVSSRPDYFHRFSARGGERPMSTGSGGRISPITRMNTGTPHERPASTQRNSTASIMTISQPLTAQQQQTHKVRQNDRPIVGKGIDVWALGVTLYCLLFGYTPFREARSEFELYNMIPKKEIVIPPSMGCDKLPTGSGIERAGLENDPRYAEGREVVDLLSRLLEKDPTKRIELWQVKRHPWVLRNLDNPQRWLQEHDLARRGLVEVTQEEVQQATAERTKPQAPQTGLKAAWKRFGETFGFGGNALRQSTAARRDRSKSFSSTSASMTTASGWDGRSDASRAASRQASIVKKKPSTVSSATASDDLEAPEKDQEQEPSLANHAAALQRKLTNAKAAQAAHEGLSGYPPEDMPTKPSEHYRSSYVSQQQQALSRSLSGESSELAEVQVKAESKHRQSLGHLLQPPATLQRRVSSGASDSCGSNTAQANVRSRANASRPSLSSVTSRPSQVDAEPETQRLGGFRNFLNKLRSGSRTPAGLASPTRTPSTRQVTGSTVPSSDTSSEPARPHGSTVQSPGSTRCTSAEFIIFSPTTSNSRPSSQDTDAAARPPFEVQATTTKDTGSTATVEGQGFGMTRGLVEEAVSDSSESLSDLDSQEGDLGEAGFPIEGTHGADTSQPSSYGHHTGPIMWSNAAEGWKFDPEMPTDPLGRYLKQQRNQAQDGNSTPVSPTGEFRASPTHESTPKPQAGNVLAGAGRNDSIDQQGDDGGAVRQPLFKSDYIPLSTPVEPRRMPSLFRDGSFSRAHAAKTSSPSPARLTRSNVPALDDEEDEEEEEEVMIKPKSRLRRLTNSTSSAPSSARPSLPASPRPSFYQPLIPP